MAITTVVDPEYAPLLGTAIFIFASFESEVVRLISAYEPAFSSAYYRGARPIMGGKLLNKLNDLVDANAEHPKIKVEELMACRDQFAVLVEDRNVLIHAHPITDSDGSQILNYQGGPYKRDYADVKWPKSEVEEAIQKFDAATSAIRRILERLLTP